MPTVSSLEGDCATRCRNAVFACFVRWCGGMVIVGLVIAGCTEVPLIPTNGRLSLGTWGADSAGVIATDSLTHVHVGCTLGDVIGRIDLDANGRFATPGTYVLRAYPVMIGPTLPAIFSGQVRGKTLTMSVSVNDTVEKRIVNLGPITVVLGVTPTMGPCPICAVPRLRQ